MGLGVFVRDTEVEAVGIQDETLLRNLVVSNLIVRPGVQHGVFVSSERLTEVNVVAVGT